jgi:hypothetical protein
MNTYELHGKKGKVDTTVNVLLTFTIIQLTSTWCNHAVEKLWDTTMHPNKVLEYKME